MGLYSISNRAIARIASWLIGNLLKDFHHLCRIDANLSADCGLYVSPCMFEGEIIRQVAPVQGLSFTTIPTDDFMDISNSVNDDIVSDFIILGPHVHGTLSKRWICDEKLYRK